MHVTRSPKRIKSSLRAPFTHHKRFGLDYSQLVTMILHFQKKEGCFFFLSKSKSKCITCYHLVATSVAENTCFTVSNSACNTFNLSLATKF